MIAPQEFRVVLLFSLVGAFHVFVFAAAFPFFNPVDEPAQFDLVLRYSRGDIPHVAGPLNPEALGYIRSYGTLEYLWDENSLPQRKFPSPPWKLPSTAAIDDFAAAKQRIWPALLDNYEAAQPPLYYIVAGAWWRFGHSLHLTEPALLFWLRFMNIFVVAGIVWLGYATARLLFPENSFVRLGVPALAAVFPQTAFYTVQNDVLSPLCFGSAFILLIKWSQTETPTVALGAAMGLALAATFLTKISNLPFLIISAAFLAWQVWRLGQKDKLASVSRSLIALIISSGLPIALWLIHTKVAFGDFTGLQAKMRILTWTMKPFPMWWHHPIFTVHGAWTFTAHLFSRFWQGEMTWHAEKPGLRMADVAYTILTFILLGASAVTLCKSWLSNGQRQALWFALAAFLAGVFFLGGLSLIFDFHNCVYPSRERPYFTSGRLILGALIPFLLLIVVGLDYCLRFAPIWIRFASLGLLTVMIPIIEVVRTWPLFFSQYNWFHL